MVDDTSRDSGSSVQEDSAPIEGVRDTLRRMGYLDDSVERFLLQDALRPERSWRSVLKLSAKVGLLSGGLLALVSALALAAVNGLLRDSPFDVVPLFIHLAPLWTLLVGFGFLLLVGLMTAILHLSHSRRIEAVSFAIAVVTALLALIFAAWQSRALLPALPWWQQGLLALPLVLFMPVLVKVIHSGLLGLSIRLLDHTPARRTPRWLWLALVGAGAFFLLVIPATLDVQRDALTTPSSLPVRAGAPAVLIGVDGVRTDELAFLLGGGELPGLDARLAAGGMLLDYDRPAVPPASFWTTVATGIADPEHGMVSLDSFRPRGMRGSLTRSGWLRHYWAFGATTRVVRYQPVLAHNRRALAFWELASRGGVPVVAVNWWGTFPATATSGLEVAHGAYQLLASEAPGVVSPAAALGGIVARRQVAVPSALHQRLAAVLTDEVVNRVWERALGADAFYRDVFADSVDDRTRAAALYLPALDIVPTLADVGTVAFGDLVRWQLQAVDRLVASLPAEVGTVAVVFDPGRRIESGTARGQVLLWHRGGCAGSADANVSAPEIASALLRALGLPQSRALPMPPAVCGWPSPGTTVDTYGVRRGDDSTRARGETYLESLRSLGYL